MYLVIITSTEIYIMDATTRILYDNNGNKITKGLLRIIAFMFKKNIIATKQFDSNGNCLWEAEALV